MFRPAHIPNKQRCVDFNATELRHIDIVSMGMH